MLTRVRQRLIRQREDRRGRKIDPRLGRTAECCCAATTPSPRERRRGWRPCSPPTALSILQALGGEATEGEHPFLKLLGYVLIGVGILLGATAGLAAALGSDSPKWFI
jgi:hypothetical protein